MNIDYRAIQAELDQLANPVDDNGHHHGARIEIKVRPDKGMAVSVGIDEYERDNKMGFRIRLNPSKIRCEGKLSECLDYAKRCVT